MKGTILDFSIQTNTGIISGEDGKRYQFTGSEWKEQQTPQRGIQVDFDSNEQGQAYGIYSALSSSSSHSASTFHNQSVKTEEQYQFIDWFIKGLKNYANFDGRASRKEFWFFMLGKYLVLLALAIMDAVLGTEGILLILGMVGLAIPEWAAGCRRLHDIGKSGWLQLLSIIPLGIIILMIWWAKEDDTHSNQYGEPTRSL
ncbi:DUF805 domain-containing protein [Alkanindiges sp. WGS2144]|uniref:DUF805 domain-containing protein n=1 Tax=Alkanindiges sp. WGS2144 TaxID=3366808 RepID=UPI0037511C4C